MIYCCSGAIFNHAREPNVSYRLNKKLNTIEYTTTKPIDSGQELCIYYGSDDKLWFRMGDAPDSQEPANLAPSPVLEDIASLPFDAETVGDDNPNAALVDESTSEPLRSPNKPLFELVKMLSVEEQEEAEGMPISTSE